MGSHYHLRAPGQAGCWWRCSRPAGWGCGTRRAAAAMSYWGPPRPTGMHGGGRGKKQGCGPRLPAHIHGKQQQVCPPPREWMTPLAWKVLQQARGQCRHHMLMRLLLLLLLLLLVAAATRTARQCLALLSQHHSSQDHWQAGQSWTWTAALRGATLPGPASQTERPGTVMSPTPSPACAGAMAMQCKGGQRG
jgi:hypothetical protein